MKNSAHSVHPDVALAVAALKKALASVYLNEDYAFTVSVEGQIVAAVGGKDEVVPSKWDASEVADETKKRAVKKAVVPEPVA